MTVIVKSVSQLKNLKYCVHIVNVGLHVSVYEGEDRLRMVK